MCQCIIHDIWTSWRTEWVILGQVKAQPNYNFQITYEAIYQQLLSCNWFAENIAENILPKYHNQLDCSLLQQNNHHAFLHISWENLKIDKSTWVQVITLCHQATSHYLSLRWHWEMLPMASLGQLITAKYFLYLIWITWEDFKEEWHSANQFLPISHRKWTPEAMGNANQRLWFTKLNCNHSPW